MTDIQSRTKNIAARVTVFPKWKYLRYICPTCNTSHAVQCRIEICDAVDPIYICNPCAIQSGLLSKYQTEILMGDFAWTEEEDEI